LCTVKKKVIEEKRLVLLKKHKWRSDVCIVYGFCHTKEEMLKPLSSGHCLFYTTIFGKSNSAPGHLKNMQGHSILLIKISQRHSLKHLQKVIVDGRKKSISMEEKNVSKVIKVPLLSNTTKRRCLHSSEDSLKQLLHKQKKVQLFGI